MLSLQGLLSVTLSGVLEVQLKMLHAIKTKKDFSTGKPKQKYTGILDIVMLHVHSKGGHAIWNDGAADLLQANG